MRSNAANTALFFPPPKIKYPNTKGLARKCLLFETLENGELPMYYRNSCGGFSFPFTDLLRALRKESKNIHTPTGEELTISDYNEGFSLVERHYLVVSNIIFNSNTLEKIKNFNESMYSKSGKRDWIINEEHRFLWTSKVHVHKDLKDNEVVLLSASEEFGVIAKKKNRMGMAIYNNYAASFIKLPNKKYSIRNLLGFFK